jgi:hypothetical protein
MFLCDGPVKSADLRVDGVAVVFGSQIGGDDDLGGVEAVVFEVGEEAIDGTGGISLSVGGHGGKRSSSHPCNRPNPETALF